MSTNSITKQKGFTIIEVVLVLAIAGLIFLIVFLALPQLQKSRRDTQRKNDVGRILSSMENYASNNSGSYPPTGATNIAPFVTAYMSNNFNDPSTGSTYSFTAAASTAPSSLGDVQYATSANCSGGAVNISGSNNRQIAVAVKLENGGTYCQANN
jgi:prepilin-type N-terminal cleavage/methylation domain-containing protein